MSRRNACRRLLGEARRAADVGRWNAAIGIGPIPVPIVPVTPAISATEIIASTEGAIVVEGANSGYVGEIAVSELATIHRHPGIAITAASHFEPLLTTIRSTIFHANLAIPSATVVDSRDALVLAAHLDALRLAVLTPLGLEVGKALASAALNALDFAATRPLCAGDALLAATALDTLRLRPAPSLGDGVLAAAAALDLRLALAAISLGPSLALTATLLGANLALTATALGLGLRLAAALGL